MRNVLARVGELRSRVGEPIAQPCDRMLSRISYLGSTSCMHGQEFSASGLEIFVGTAAEIRGLPYQYINEKWNGMGGAIGCFN